MRWTCAVLYGALAVTATQAHAADPVEPSDSADATETTGATDAGEASEASEASDTESPESPESIEPSEGPSQLSLPRGRWLINAYLESNLSSGVEFQPVSLSPDIWYGASDRWTIGIVHSSLGETGFMGGVGDSLCLTGSANGCGHFYNRVAVQARYGVSTGTWAWAAVGGLGARALSPFQFAGKIGVVGRWHSSGFAVELEPALTFGVTHRDPATGGVPNKEIVTAPITALYFVNKATAVALQTGLVLPLENASTTFSIPLSLGAHYRVSEPLSITLAFSFLDLVGGSNGSGVDARSLTLGASYAL